MKLLYLLLLSIFCGLFVQDSDITWVCTQDQFDVAVERINRGETSNIIINRGRYVLNKSIKAHAPLYIKGNNVIITCANTLNRTKALLTTQTHIVYKLNNPLSAFTLFYDKKGNLLPISESISDSLLVNYVDGEILSSSTYESGSLIKIPIPESLEHLKNKVFSRAFGYLDSGWCVVNFRLNESDSDFFYCTTLSRCYTKDYNYDNKVYKKPIRYVIYNAELKRNGIYYDNESLYVPKESQEINYLCMADENNNIPAITAYSDVFIDGVTFEGFSRIYVNSPKDAICNIRNCSFKKSLGCVLKIDKENGVMAKPANISNCLFTDCALQSENIIYLSSNFAGKTCISMRDCTIIRYPQGIISYKNTSGAVYVTADAEIKDNYICNTCRDHLFLWKGSIIVQNNVLLNTDFFNKQVDRNLSEDWGLIYCNHIYKNTEDALNNTEKNHILIENNLLYGAYGYAGYARGIYIDDGRGDVECRNNIILNTQLYSIDSRSVKLTDASSTRNRYEGNIVTSRYKLVAGPAVSGNDIPVTKSNVLLNDNENVTEGVEVLVEDTHWELDSECYCTNGKVYVPRDLYRKLKRSPAWRSVRRHVGRK